MAKTITVELLCIFLTLNNAVIMGDAISCHQPGKPSIEASIVETIPAPFLGAQILRCSTTTVRDGKIQGPAAVIVWYNITCVEGDGCTCAVLHYNYQITTTATTTSINKYLSTNEYLEGNVTHSDLTVEAEGISASVYYICEDRSGNDRSRQHAAWYFKYQEAKKSRTERQIASGSGSTTTKPGTQKMPTADIIIAALTSTVLATVVVALVVLFCRRNRMDNNDILGENYISTDIKMQNIDANGSSHVNSGFSDPNGTTKPKGNSGND